MKGFLTLVLGMVLFGTGISTGSAQILLSVQFQDTSDSAPAQSGFFSFPLSKTSNPSNPTQSYIDSLGGTLSVELFGAATQTRYTNTATNSSNFTNANLFNSFAVQFTQTAATDNGATTLPGLGKTSFEISGLAANTQYQLQIWSVDPRNATNLGAYDWWYDTTAGVGSSAVLLGGIQNHTTTAFTQPPNTTASNNLYSALGIVTSDSSGNIFLSNVASTGNSGLLNGFTLAAVPEPSTYALLLAGLAALVFASRRRLRG